MKIAPINLQGNINSFNKISKNTTNVVNNQQIAIHDNKFADLTGRSLVKRVNFKGIDNYNCGPNTVKEEIKGDDFTKTIEFIKTTGYFCAITRDKQGNVKKIEEYNPATKTQTTVSYNDDGSRIETRKLDDRFYYTKYDNKNRVAIYYEKCPEYSRSVRNDYDNNRQIVNYKDDLGEINKVYNLRTREEITSGDMIYEEVYNKETGSYVKRNLLTNIVEREEWKLLNGETYILLEYYPESGTLGHKSIYNSATNDYDHEYFRPDGTREIAVLSNANKNILRNVYYAPNGEDIVRDLEEEKNRQGKRINLREFVPGTDYVLKHTHYISMGKEITYFNPESHKKETFEIYRKSSSTGEEFIQKREEYYEDGTTPKTITSFKKTGEYKKTIYSSQGAKCSEYECDANDKTQKVRVFDKFGEKLTCLQEYDYKNRVIHITQYDRDERPWRKYDILIDQSYLLYKPKAK